VNDTYSGLAISCNTWATVNIVKQHTHALLIHNNETTSTPSWIPPVVSGKMGQAVVVAILVLRVEKLLDFHQNLRSQDMYQYDQAIRKIHCLSHVKHFTEFTSKIWHMLIETKPSIQWTRPRNNKNKINIKHFASAVIYIDRFFPWCQTHDILSHLSPNAYDNHAPTYHSW
jgi:hypothetical protein